MDMLKVTEQARALLDAHGDKAEAEAMLVRITKVDAQVLAAAPKLKIISRHGVGCDNIDLPAAKAAGC